VAGFEKAICDFTGAKYGVAVSSGTAALHAAMNAAAIGPGDEVIVPAMTFAATANCVVYQGGTPVFADVEADTLLIDPDDVERKITARTRAVIAVDYAGQPCDYDRLRQIADSHGLVLAADACHSLGARYKGRRAGTLADLTVFSFHPVKHITTGEGGMIVTDDAGLAEKMRRFRNHGINADHHQRRDQESWFYEMESLGFNYRLTDIQCALGISQLRKLPQWLARRQEIAEIYDRELDGLAGLSLLRVRENISHARHLYVVLLADEQARKSVFTAMRRAGIGVNVHYYPLHLHRYYRENFKTKTGLCPAAEAACQRILSLPMHAGLTASEIERVWRQMKKSLAGKGSGLQKVAKSAA
jgi:perosamine synthetase